MNLAGMSFTDENGNIRFAFGMEETNLSLGRGDIAEGCYLDVFVEDETPFLEWADQNIDLLLMRMSDNDDIYLEMTEKDVEGRFVSKQVCGYEEDSEKASQFNFRTKGGAGILEFRLFVGMSGGASVNLPPITFYSTVSRDT